MDHHINANPFTWDTTLTTPTVLPGYPTGRFPHPYIQSGEGVPDGIPVTVRPVTTTLTPATLPTADLSVLFGPAGVALAKNLVPPRLDPNRGNEFLLAFPSYLESLAGGYGVLPDDVSLSVLEQSLIPAGVAELKRRREQAARGEPR